jgi:hypothetical protein
MSMVVPEAHPVSGMSKLRNSYMVFIYAHGDTASMVFASRQQAAVAADVVFLWRQAVLKSGGMPSSRHVNVPRARMDRDRSLNLQIQRIANVHQMRAFLRAIMPPAPPISYRHKQRKQVAPTRSPGA